MWARRPASLGVRVPHCLRVRGHALPCSTTCMRVFACMLVSECVCVCVCARTRACVCVHPFVTVPVRVGVFVSGFVSVRVFVCACVRVGWGGGVWHPVRMSSFPFHMLLCGSVCASACESAPICVRMRVYGRPYFLTFCSLGPCCCDVVLWPMQARNYCLSLPTSKRQQVRLFPALSCM